MSSCRRTISTNIIVFILELYHSQVNRTFRDHIHVLILVCFVFVCVFVLLRHYLETRSLNHRINSWEGHNWDMTCEQDSHECSYRDGDRDWHHYSKSSGRSGRSHRSRRSSRRHRDRRHRRSHSRHRSSSVWKPPSSLFPSSPCL